MLPTDSPQVYMQKFMLRSVVRVSFAMEKFTSWTLAAVAASVAFCIAHLESVRAILKESDVKIALTALILSLLFGVLSKNLGQGVTFGLKNIEQLEEQISSPALLEKMNDSALPTADMSDFLANAFLWPLSTLMRRSNKTAINDPLQSDVYLARIFSWQWRTNVLHVALALFGPLWAVLRI